MPVLNTADALYLGDVAVDAVYAGAVKVWPPEPPKLLFDVSSQDGFLTDPQDLQYTVPPGNDWTGDPIEAVIVDVNGAEWASTTCDTSGITSQVHFEPPGAAQAAGQGRTFLRRTDTGAPYTTSLRWTWH